MGETLLQFGKAAKHEEGLREGEPEKFGKKLYDMLFVGSVKDLFDKTLKVSKRMDGVTVIGLDIQPPELGRIPWELLHDGDDFLALSRKTPVTRFIPEPAGAGTMKPIEFPIRILFAGAKPYGTVPLNLGGQIRKICRALQQGLEKGEVILHPAVGSEVEANAFLSHIRSEAYHILHISTHGAFSEDLDRGFLALEDGLGKSSPVAVTALAGRLRDTQIRLIYLDACETGQSSQMDSGKGLTQTVLRSGAGAAVAMQFSILDDSATRFSEAFYHHLMNGKPLWYAVTEARITLLDLLGQERIDWAIPVLNMRQNYTFTTTGQGESKTRFGKINPPLRFVGRDQQLDELAEKLLNSSTRLMLVHGFGGIGKSTLVQKVLSEIELLFDDTCFIDCRGVKSISDVMPKICSMLSVNAVPVLESRLQGLNESGKIEYVCEQLNKGKFLIVLDNIDDMLDNPTIGEFVSHVQGFRNAKVLFSCRILSKVLASQRELRLGVLEQRFAFALIREIGRDIPRIRDASDSDLLRMNEKLGGHPYSIVIAVPLFAVEPFETVLSDLPERVGSEDEQSRRVLEWSYGKLSQPERTFLENISVFSGEVPQQALLGMNDGKGEEILRDVVKKNMVEFSSLSGVYSLHPMLRDHAFRMLGHKQEQVKLKAAREIAPRLVGGWWTEALELYVAGVNIARRKKDQKLLQVLLGELANMYGRTGHYDKARMVCSEIVDISERLGDQSGSAKVLHTLGNIEYLTGNYDEAKRLYNESLELKKKIGDLADIAVTINQLGMIEESRGNYGEAMRLCNESLEISRRIADRSGITLALSLLGNIKYLMGECDEAAKIYLRVKEISEELGEQLGIATALHQLAMIEEHKRGFDEARRLYERSLEIKRKLGDQSGIAKTLHQLGNISYQRGNYDAAVKLYNESLEIDRKLGDQDGIAITIHQLGMIEQDQGNFDKAKRLYDQSLEIKKRLGDQSGIAKTLYQLGMIEEHRHNYDEAKRLYTESLEIRRGHGDQSGIAKTLHQLGNTEYLKGNYDEAERLYNQSLEIERELGDQQGIAETLHQLGMIEQRRGNYDEAKKLYDESLEINGKLGHQSGAARTLGRLGLLFEQRGDLEVAEKYIIETLEIFRRIGDKNMQDVASRHLARIRNAMKKQSNN